MALVLENFPVIIDLFTVKENPKNKDKPFFQPVGISFLGEKDTKDGPEPKLSINLNLFPGLQIYGTVRRPKDNDNASSGAGVPF